MPTDWGGVDPARMSRLGRIRAEAARRDLWGRAACFVGLAALAVLLLWPTLKVGYFSDDVLTSLTPGIMKVTGLSFTGRVVQTMKDSFRQGRFYPLHWLPFNGVFWLIRDVQTYRIFIFTCVLVNLLLFLAFVKQVSRNTGLAYLATALTCMLIQLRAFHDPILSFFGLVQIVMALTLVSLMALWQYLERGGKGWLVASIALHATCVLMYELSYLFFFFHAFLIWSRRRQFGAWFWLSAPFVGASAFCIGESFLLRWIAPQNSQMNTLYRLELSPAKFLPALARQTSGALPLSYFVTDPAGLFQQANGWGSLARWLQRPDVLVVGLLALVVSVLALRRRAEGREEAGPARRLGLMVAFALLLAVVPGVMTSLTSRYQKDVTVGMSYIPVYMQYFGVGLLLAAGLWAVLERWASEGWRGRLARIAVGLLVASTTAVTYRANCATASSLISPPGAPDYNVRASWYRGQWHYQRLNLESALRAGLLANVPEHSTLKVSHEYVVWHDGECGYLFYATYAGKNLVVVPPGQTAETVKQPKPADTGSGRTFIEHDVCLGRRAGFVVLSEEGAGGDGVFRLFVRHPGLFGEGDDPGFLVTGDLPGAGAYLKPGRELRLLRSGPDWGLFSLRSEAGQVDPGSIQVVFNPAKAARMLAERSERLRR